MTTRHMPALPMLRAGAGAIALALLAACGDNSNQTAANSNTGTAVLLGSSSGLVAPRYAVEIRRTSHGIPHVRALDEGSLGFGVAYAFAQDNICQLADEIVTVNGERSKHFGVGPSSPTSQLSNEQTDYFYRLINDPAAVANAWRKHSADSRSLLQGYVAGFNHYLDKTGAANLPAECRNAAWVRKLSTDDMIKLIRRYAVEAGAGQFIPQIVGATPPTLAAAPTVAPAGALSPMSPHYWKALRNKTGSNAVALGREATSNGQGLLLSNPHFPWNGSLRFYQVHLTIPGKVDAMGASLGGMPVVNIGFNRHLAWGHTVNTSAHFTAFVLNLDPASPTRFILDGQPQDMTKKTVSIQVKNADGSLTTQSRDFYSTPFGMLAVDPGMLDWSKELAFTIRDANLDNHRMLEQWTAMNRAQSINEFKNAVQRIVGLPWVNTLAADKHGNTLFLDVTVVPHVSQAKLAQCVPEPFKELAGQGLIVLSGAYSACQWSSDPSAPQEGIFAGKSLPALARADYVQNSNDSAWLSNPKTPLTGFPSIVSIDGTEQSGRTRIGISQVQARLSGADGLSGRRMSLDQLQTLALSNRAYFADLVKDDLARLCAGDKAASAEDGTPVDLTLPCQQLASWDRTANLNAGIGLAYFEGLWNRARLMPNLWSVPFNPLDPVNTPRGLNVGDAGAAQALKTALATSVLEAQAFGWTGSTVWGEVQGTMRGDRWVPIHGASGDLGVYNAVESFPVAPGVRAALYGTSYIQAVELGKNGPTARALLSYSQSSNPASPYYGDQTERFSRKEWVNLPFNELQILTDKNYKTTLIVK